MEIDIRKASGQDIDGIAQLYDDLNDYLAEHTNYPGWAKGVYPTREDAEQGYAESALFVAEIDDEVAGTIILNHEPEQGYEKAIWLTESDYSNIIVIRTLAIHPQFLKTGVGKALMQFAKQYAKQQGMQSIRLDVYDQNLPAIKLYEQSGYTYIANVDLGYKEYGLDAYNLYELVLL